MKSLWHIAASIVLITSMSAWASPHEVTIPLHDGYLKMADLSGKLLAELHLPTKYLPPGEINLEGLRGSLFVAAMNRSLGDACRLEVRQNKLVLHVDAEKLPKNIRAAKRAVRIFTATVAPRATAAQARHYGLLLPTKLDTRRPLVILVHGLDMGNAAWSSMAKLLAGAGYQVAYFGYPGDEPIDADAALLTQHMTALHDVFPKLKLDIVSFSMGALVSRAYIEGGSYQGGVDHFIMLAPPNHGSTWAYLQILGEWKEHVELALHDPEWSPTWMVTDGLGEAGHDLLPESKFLDQLNTHARRPGVHYTIIVGNERVMRRVAAECVKESEALIPLNVATWWGFRQCRAGMLMLSSKITQGKDSCDGPVALGSAALSGVSDVVTVHADHETIYQSEDGHPPAAWDTIQNRLAN